MKQILKFTQKKYIILIGLIIIIIFLIYVYWHFTWNSNNKVSDEEWITISSNGWSSSVEQNEPPKWGSITKENKLGL